MPLSRHSISLAETLVRQNIALQQNKPGDQEHSYRRVLADALGECDDLDLDDLLKAEVRAAIVRMAASSD